MFCLGTLIGTGVSGALYDWIGFQKSAWVIIGLQGVVVSRNSKINNCRTAAWCLVKTFSKSTCQYNPSIYSRSSSQ